MAYFGHGGEERSVDLSDLSDMLRGGPSARVPTQAPAPSINKDDDDDGSKGRIFAAVSGNRDGWHERGRASSPPAAARERSPARPRVGPRHPPPQLRPGDQPGQQVLEQPAQEPRQLQ